MHVDVELRRAEHQVLVLAHAQDVARAREVDAVERGDLDEHVWLSGHADITAQLAFRDRLRESPEDRAANEALKRELVSRDWTDMNHYADAKGPLIREILARAATG